jgi:lysyl-tRNA synthetase class 2
VSDAHPAWSGPRRPLADAQRRAADLPFRVAGRYFHACPLDVLEDASGIVSLVASASPPPHGAIVAGVLARSCDDYSLGDVEVLALPTRELPPEIRCAAGQRVALQRRAAIVAALRATLVERRFLEVETPARVINPGLEPHLRPFPAGASQGEPRFLVTSPELHLKRLLAAGYERFFELGRAFRDEEHGALHVSEFLMLEWYRAYAGLEDLARDVHALLPACARAAGLEGSGIRGCDLAAEPEVVGYHEAFERLAGCAADGLDPFEREQRFALRVEPSLGLTRPALVVDWPADEAALARTRRDASGRAVAARMELYIAGVELANGFDELNDPAEQRLRHEADRAARARAGTVVPPLDEGFLAAIEAGMPPSAGMALGVDRLVMLLLGARSIAEIRLFAE